MRMYHIKKHKHIVWYIVLALIGLGMMLYALSLQNQTSPVMSGYTSYADTSLEYTPSVRTGTPLSPHAFYTYLTTVPTPRIQARSYLVADLETGHILLEKDSTRILPIASITKLMTALVTIDRLPRETITSVSRRALNTGGGLRGNLSQGQQLSLNELIYPLLLTSSNEASEVIAETYGRTFFYGANEQACF
ncbi:MAG: hypothetical protein LRY46_03635 [Candidatus Pacebacteria bacterium]|nr:hypothetical protein [Candidatus Paceibacterota bacterium]